jgi:hypothetical protein
MLLESEDDATTSGLKRLQRFLKSTGMLDQKVASLGVDSPAAKSKK